MKEKVARPQYECSMTVSIVSFESFGKEFISVARLTLRGSLSESERCATRKGEAAGCESARVTGIRPEIPEARIKFGLLPLDSGPNGLLLSIGRYTLLSIFNNETEKSC